MKILNSTSINHQYSNLVNKTICSIEATAHFMCNARSKNVLSFKTPIPLITTEDRVLYLISITSNQEVTVTMGSRKANISEARWLSLTDPNLQLQDLISILEELEKL